MMRPCAAILCGVLFACSGKGELRWTDTRTPPSGALEDLADELPPLFHTFGREMASSYLSYMIEDAWRGKEDGWGQRHVLEDRYERARAEIEGKASGQRVSAMALLTYEEGRSYIAALAEELAYRRLALDRPDIAAAATGRGEGYRFRSEPSLDREQLTTRADALERDVEELRRRYRGLIGWEVACWREVDDRHRAVLTHLANARGDFGVTTGEIHRMLKLHLVRTRPLTSFDAGVIVEPHCRPPWEADGPP